MIVASKLSLFLAELKRRKVYRVAAVYAAAGVAISLAVPDLFGAFDLPTIAARLVIVLIAIGFPIALILAWAYEVKPEESPTGAAFADENPGPGMPSPLHPTHRPEDLRPSVAVLPFVNLSADPENEYFSDGISFDIINHLAKITDLKVISRTSIMQYKETEKPLRQIGEELGVASIVEGEVQRVGDRVRISAQLLDARTDEHLWAEQFDREILDVFAVQSEVAQSVAAALTAKLTPSEKKRIERIPTADIAAYDLYLRGRHHWEKRGKGLMEGLEYFRRALEIDPDYALAHAGVADCYSLIGFYGFLPPREAMPQAKAAALRALEIDDELAEAICSLGFIREVYDWDLDGAEREYRRAIELNPGYAPVYYWRASAASMRGRFDEAIRYDQQAVDLAPLSAITNTHLGWILLAAREFEWARDQAKIGLGLDPDFALAYWVLGAAFVNLGLLAEASGAFEEGVRVSASDPWLLAALGAAQGLSGRGEEARGVLSRLGRMRKDRYVRPFHLAVVNMGLGELDEALGWLEKAYDDRDWGIMSLAVDPQFDPLRAEPRFLALQEKAGFGSIPGVE
jgi:adenylate cyclase